MNTKRNLAIAAVHIATSAVASSAALAADAPAETPVRLAAAAAGSGLEEVIVTARKTEESAQVVPISMTALSGADLDKSAITDIHNVRVPGLYVTDNTQTGTATFAIRGAKTGIGTGDTVTT